MKLLSDSDWIDYRTDEYYDVLRSTTWIWLCLVESCLNRPSNVTETAVTEAYKRAIIALVQGPAEYGHRGPSKRFDRCRWRSSEVTMTPAKNPHCEHPWSKKITKSLLWDHCSAALLRGVKKEDLIVPASEILDARQDTVLLSNMKTSNYGVLSERAADGLLGRYSSAVEKSAIVLHDRKTGGILTVEDIKVIESDVQQKVAVGVEKLDVLGKIKEE